MWSSKLWSRCSLSERWGVRESSLLITKQLEAKTISGLPPGSPTTPLQRRHRQADHHGNAEHSQRRDDGNGL